MVVWFTCTSCFGFDVFVISVGRVVVAVFCFSVCLPVLLCCCGVGGVLFCCLLFALYLTIIRFGFVCFAYVCVCLVLLLFGIWIGC